MNSRAYHEAGHTVIAEYLGFEIEFVTISDEITL